MFQQFKFPFFKPLQIEDKFLIDHFNNKFDPYSDFNFVSLWSYNTNNTFKLCTLNENLVLWLNDYEDTNDQFLTFIGTNKIEDTAIKLLEFSRNYKLSPHLRLIPYDVIKEIDTYYPFEFLIEEDEHNKDYILSTKETSEMIGGKYKGLRKNFNKFSNNQNLKVLDIDVSNQNIQNQIIDLFDNWATNKRNTDIEKTAISRYFECSKVTNMLNMGVYEHDKLIAFTLNEIVHNDHAIGHFGKYDYSYPGVSRSLEIITSAKLYENKVNNINIEQDLGNQRLKTFKESLRPKNYLKKFTIKKI